jgi:methylated-DNA-protein-cysteine methyltransferase-like protein
VKDTHDDRSFEQDVYDVVRAVPEGRVTSYGAIAKVLGSARASRRVGWVLNKSFGAEPPVPAHRVVNRLGMLSGAIHFPADRPMAAQLEAEGVRIENDTVVDFERVFWDPMREL